MSDPRNVAHEKKVKQEKQHGKPESDTGGKAGKEKRKKAATAAEPEQTPAAAAAAPAEVAKEPQGPTDAEKTIAVLSKLKEMEFHSRANIETLAELTLTIEEELKQKEFSDPIGALYSTQNDFQTKIAALIENYEAASRAS